MTAASGIERHVTVVTGAGASTALGIDGVVVPTMSGWVNRLMDLSPSGARWVGLTRESDTFAFETKLGHFLNFQGSLDDCISYLDDRDGTTAEKLRTIRDIVTDFSSHVAKSVNDSFAADCTDPAKSADAYGKLISALGISSEEGLALLTTNFDMSAEQALDRIGYSVFWGERAALNNDNVRIYPDFADIGRSTVPVLHLHGAVNWWESNGGKVYRVTEANRSSVPASSVPAMLLPGLDKSYDRPFLRSIWEHAERIVLNSSRVMVIGNSLHDRRLVQLLTVVPPQHLGIGLNVRANDTADSWNKRSRFMAERTGLQAHFIPISFGPNLKCHEDSMRRFLRHDSIELEVNSLDLTEVKARPP